MKRTLLLLLALCVIAPSLFAQGQSCSSPYFIDQPFPSSGTEVSRWRLCWTFVNGPGLVITGAFFRPTPTSPFIKVLYDGRLAELFVPYHPGSPRYHDITYSFGPVPLSQAQCTGTILGTNKETCKEVRDRGIMWMWNSSSRRGQELVLWSVLAAANYNYIIEWSFRDDGVFSSRIGATGVPAGQATHLHGPVWRLDIDLNGACCDTVTHMSHKEIGAKGFDTMTTVANATGFHWDPVAYTSLHVTDATLRTPGGKTSGWMFMPERGGTPFHQEPFTWYTYWVTPYVWNQTDGAQLPTYVANAPNTQNTDTVLWYYGGLHHIIRAEDNAPNGASQMTLAMYEGWHLMPVAVWDSTPFYP
ncbi:MAG: copper amine oxidase [Thermoanaerobaculia bacterium]